MWGVQSCLSTCKYSVRLQRCNSPRGLYLEARNDGFFAQHLVSKSYFAPILKTRPIDVGIIQKKESCIYPHRGLKKRNYTPDEKKTFFCNYCYFVHRLSAHIRQRSNIHMLSNDLIYEIICIPIQKKIRACMKSYPLLLNNK